VPLEDRLDARQSVIDLDYLPGERVETGFKTGESGVHAGFEAGESRTHARFEAGQPSFHAGKSSANGIHLQNSRHDAHHNREHWHTDREIQLSVSHAWFHYTGKTKEYPHSTPAPPDYVGSEFDDFLFPIPR
jgi:hypothetical protein